MITQDQIKELEKRVSLLTKERIRLQRDKSLAELKLSNLELGESNNNFWLDDDIISLMVPFLFFFYVTYYNIIIQDIKLNEVTFDPYELIILLISTGKYFMSISILYLLKYYNFLFICFITWFINCISTS